MTWETFAFRDLFTIKHGFAFKSESFANQGLFVVLTPGHFAEVGGFRYRNGSEKYYLGWFPEEYLLEEGSLLVVMTEQAPGLLGSPILIPEGNKYLHNQRLGLVQEIEYSRICKEFLYHLFNSHSVRKQISLMAGGTKVRHISPTKILDVHIDLPSLPEQKKIAKILNCWDTAIAQMAKLIEAKRNLKKGLMQQLLTSKWRFLKATDTWSRINLGSAIRCYSGGTPSRTNDSLFEGSIPWIKSGELNSKDIYSTEESISEEAVNESAVKYVYPNTLLYALYGATAGVPAFSKIRATINQAVLAIIPDESLNSEYLYYWLLHSRQHLRQKYTQGGQPNLSAQLVKEFEVPVPSLAEQKCIVSVLNTIDQEIETLCRLSDRLKEQKRGLMQKLLTGQIRVKTTEEITAS